MVELADEGWFPESLANLAETEYHIETLLSSYSS